VWEKNTCQTLAESPQPFCDWLVVKYPGGDNAAITLQLRPDAVTGGPSRMNEITNAHLLAIAPEIAKGSLVGIGEYRSGACTEREGKDFKDSSKKIRIVTATHRIEFGGVQRVIEERLPDTTKIEAFVAPAKSGDIVGFAFTKSAEFNKETKWYGRIFALTTAVATKPAAK